MHTRVALVGIMIEDTEQAAAVNGILHEFATYIVARMGVPYEKKHLSMISVMVDGPQDSINHLSGKLGRLQGVSVKTIYAKV